MPGTQRRERRWLLSERPEAGCARGQPGIHSESRADLDYSIDSVSKTEKGAGVRGGRGEKERNERWMDGGNVYNPMRGGGRGIRSSHSS